MAERRRPAARTARTRWSPTPATVQWAQGQARQAIDVYESGQRATAAATAAYNSQVAAYNQAAQAYDSALAAGRSPGPRPAQPGPFTDPGRRCASGPSRS